MKKTIITKVTKVFKSDKSKAGVAFKDKNGKPFWKVGILTEATGDKWYSALAFREDSAEMKIAEGSAYTLLVWEENGFANFKLPSKTDLLEERVKALEDKVYGKIQGPVPTEVDYLVE